MAAIFDLKLVTDVESELLTLSDVKAHLYITHSDDDTYLTALITRVRKMVENYCVIAIGSQEWVWLIESEGEMQIPRQPVISVDAVSYNVAGTYTAADSTQYTIDGVFEKTFTPESYGRWKVEYTTGYTTLPDDLKQGMLVQIAYLYENRGDASKQGLCEITKDLIAPYRDLSWI